jgi:transcription elongation factor Elf1
MPKQPEYPTSVDERPTIPGWAAEAILELQAQLDRLFSGRACKACLGAGTFTVKDRTGFYVVACGTCDGQGMCAPNVAP